MTDPFNNKDYEDFINSEGSMPPQELDTKIISFVRYDLSPDMKIVFSKLDLVKSAPRRFALLKSAFQKFALITASSKLAYRKLASWKLIKSKLEFAKFAFVRVDPKK